MKISVVHPSISLVVSTYNIPTPILTETTSPANSAPTFSIGVTGYPIGLYWNIQLASDSGFTTALSGEGAIRDEIRIITVTDLTDDDLSGTVEADAFESMVAIPSGNTYVRLRIGRESDDGLSMIWGSWSNSVFENVVTVTPTTLDAASKGNDLTLSGGNLAVTNNLINWGAPEFARANTAKTGKLYFETSLTTWPSQTIAVGVGASTSDFGSGGYQLPGSGSFTAGASLNVSIGGGGTISFNGGSYSPSIGTWAQGDLIAVCIKTSTNKIWFGRIPSGGSSVTWDGDPSAETGGQTLTGMDVWYPFVGPYVIHTSQRTATINFGATAFAASSLPTGASAYI